MIRVELTEITLATSSFLSGIMALLHAYIEDLPRQGNDQWGGHYPTEEIIARDLENGNLGSLSNKIRS
jgi:hypothetical protein